MSDERGLKLNDFQRRTITAAITALGIVVITAILLLCFYILRMFVGTFSGVLWPLAAAGILAMLLRPVTAMFEKRLNLGHLSSIILLFVFLAIALSLLGYAVFSIFNQQVLDFFKDLPGQIRELINSVRQKFPQIMTMGENIFGKEKFDSMMNDLVNSAKDGANYIMPLIKKSGQSIMSIFGLATQVAIIPVYLFFLLLSNRDYALDLKSELSFLGEEIRDDLIFLCREFVGIIVSFFRGQLVIGLIMGVLYAIGFTLVGLDFGFLIGLAMGFLNIVPYLGTILGLAVALPVAYLQPDGGTSTLVFVLVVFAAVQMAEGYFLTPKIMGKQTGLHPMVIIIAIFFWGTALDGILGMILAIPLTAFFVVAWRLIKVKYLPRLTKPKDGERGPPPADAAHIEG